MFTPLENILRDLIRRFDGFLRHRQGVYEFCDAPGCILRIRLARAPHAVDIAGERIPPGAPIVEIHLWNERILPLPPEGASLVWAVRMQRLFAGSLRLLARQMQDDPRLAGAIAIGGVTALLAPADHPGGVRLMEHLGFTVEPYRSLLGRFGEFWENFYTWWIMWTFNAASLRGRRLVRLQRAEIWMSREKLLDKYGK